MLRTVVAFLVILAIALPGVPMASHADHAGMPVAHSGMAHDHARNDPKNCADCETEVALYCCAMAPGHCASFGIAHDVIQLDTLDWASRRTLSIAYDIVHDGKSFEADPPPPRA